MLAPYTSLYAAALALFIARLALAVVGQRRKHAIGIGHGGVEEAERAIRAHANAVEYVPLALVLMALFEINGGHPYVVHAFGGALVLARLLHAYGLGRSSGASPGRYWGTVLTFVTWIGLAVGNVVLFFWPR